MLKNVSLLACVLLLGVMLAACAGDDDDDPTATVAPSTATTAPSAADDASTPTAEVAETPTEAAEEPTATEEVTTPTVEPTEEADPTATTEAAESTATPEARATQPADPTEDPAGSTATPDAEFESDPAVEAALLDMLLSAEDVPAEFQLVSAGPVATTNGGLTFCNAESFSRPEARLGGVEAEFEADPQLGPFVLESLTAYDEDTAAEAFDFARDITTSCEEWTDEDGVTYQLETVEVPEYGDDSHGLRMTFDVPGAGLASVEFTLARFGGVLLAMGFISLEGTDTSQFAEITETAIEKIEAADPLP